MAVEITAKSEGGSKPVPFSEVVKATYSQNWTGYIAAQTNEKDMFPRLLNDLCTGIEEPLYCGIGRPRLRVAEMAFAVTYRAYVGCSFAASPATSAPPRTADSCAPSPRSTACSATPESQS